MKPAPRMDVVKREAKEAKLTDFIAASLATRAGPNITSTGSAAAATWLLVARSAESPVVKALSALGPQLQQANISVRAIFAMLDHGASDTQAQPMIACPLELRVARNPKLLEAHEMLILGPDTCWIGDSMRREPDKRDAYECYAADHATTARWSTVSFERLWAIAEALVPRTTASAPVEEAGASDDAAQVPAADMVPAAEQPAATTASTRH